jgi:hypothetical protein
MLSAEAKKKLSTQEASNLLDKRNALRRHIEKWQEVQSLYMPGAVQPSSSSGFFERPETIPLQLPSGLPAACRLMLPGGLVQKELRMRIAQADDALAELRKMLRVSMGLSYYKYSQVGFGQRPGTRARTLAQRYWMKVTRCANRYRAARSALVILNPMHNSLIRLQPLDDRDVRKPGRSKDDESESEGEGVRELSWIWMVQRDSLQGAADADEDEVNDSECFDY